MIRRRTRVAHMVFVYKYTSRVFFWDSLRLLKNFETLIMIILKICVRNIKWESDSPGVKP